MQCETHLEETCNIEHEQMLEVTVEYLSLFPEQTSLPYSVIKSLELETDFGNMITVSIEMRGEGEC